MLASLSFGAGLPAFFIVAAIFLLRREHRGKTIAMAAAGVVVLAGWLLTKPAGAQSLATTALDPDGRLSVAAAALGSLWSGDHAVTAVLAGALTSALLAACAISARATRAPPDGSASPDTPPPSPFSSPSAAPAHSPLVGTSASSAATPSPVL
ncbi:MULTISPECIES: hypothetical protein [unclassified Amycolatopsis]|uniref:hypothetical protein n=1 Tax=unclassified Amycolatopsis TaxID=2618356 RepID=UPI00039DAD7B|nr:MULTISPECIES: hypothetical protein [unclassified Amycolatopsis]